MVNEISEVLLENTSDAGKVGPKYSLVQFDPLDGLDGFDLFYIDGKLHIRGDNHSIATEYARNQGLYASDGNIIEFYIAIDYDASEITDEKEASLINWLEDASMENLEEFLNNVKAQDGLVVR